MSEKSSKKATYLLDGRRVTLSHLIDAGLLESGERLVFERPQVGETHQGTVSASGRLRLQDGEEYATPSGAAAAATGLDAYDGWRAWTVASSGRVLDELRQELLDDVATAEKDQGLDPDESTAGDSTAPLRRHQFLRRARTAAEDPTQQPMELTVRDLISRWGAKGRGSSIARTIETDLANHGLVSVPSFRAVALDSPVALRAADSIDEDQSPSPSEEDEDYEVGLTVGNIPSALGGIASVTSQESLETAITKMLLDDYSQLAVMNGPRTLKGAVTWKSIAAARHRDHDAELGDVIVQSEPIAYDRELVGVLHLIREHDFFFVRDETNQITGIVTAADVVDKYDETATPFFLIGEIDQTLRYVIGQRFDLPAVFAICDPDGSRQLQEMNQLSMGDYIRVLERPDMWASLGWPIDRAYFVNRLNEIREIRNDVMHFNPDPLTEDAVGQMQNLLKLLHAYA